MSDFVSGFWSVYVALITIVSIAGCGVLLWMQSKVKQVPVGAEPELKDHVWDEDLQEYNNPLPRWWMWLFYITVFFALGYLAVYPGLGSYQGSSGWTSVKEYEDEMKQANAKYMPIFEQFANQDIKAVAADPKARQMGERLFVTYCAQCHGSDARGAKGFPNLTDNDWLYGGEPDQIKQSIMEGRNGVMPAGLLAGEEARDVAHYVRSLSGMTADSVRIARGKEKFAATCAACHGPDGKGMQAVGAPNLTDQTWLYGSSEATILEGIAKGRNNQMPAHKEFLGEAKVHLLAAYVYGLSAGAARTDKK
jgi:cytochrome c oxidase cbb3-type subunit 3